MEITDNHKAELNKYLEFFTRKRKEVLQELDLIADDFTEDNIAEGDLYNGEDVSGFIQKLCKEVHNHTDNEIRNMVRLTGVYLQMAFSIAEKTGTDININLNHIEDCKMAEQVGALESGSFKRQGTNNVGAKLPPVSVGADLQSKIDSLNDQLQRAQKENLTLERTVIETKKQLAEANGEEEVAPEPTISAVKAKFLEERISSLEEQLEAKVQGSKQVQNLKKMLQSKNDKLKSLKERLLKYEPLE